MDEQWLREWSADECAKALAENEQLRAENMRQARHLRVWQQGFQETAAATRAELAGLRTSADPAKRLLSNILAVVNRHQGANAEQAMAEIHEVCTAFLDAVPAADTTSDPDYPDVSGGGVPYLPVIPPAHPIG